MRAALLGVLTLAVLATQAVASAYSDFNQGLSAHNIGDDAETVRLMSLALADPALPGHLRPAALLDRGHAYARNKQYDLALADFTAGLGLVPGNYTLLMERAGVHQMKKEFDLARADYTDAIRARPELSRPYAAHGATYMQERRFDEALKDYGDGLAASWWTLDFYILRSEAYRLSARYSEAIKEADTAISRDEKLVAAYIARGRARDDSGDMKGALADYDKAHDLASDDPEIAMYEGITQWKLGRFDEAARSFRHGPETSSYFFIWSYLADGRRRPGVRGLAEKAAKIASTDWPMPIVRLIAGTSTAEAALAAAGEGDAGAQKEKTCEADFYIGEWQLIQDDKAAAIPLLNDAAKACETGSAELGAAKAELGRVQ